MRRQIRHHALSLLVFLSALSLAGCYTMLKHPDVSDQYAFEDDEEIVIVDRCGECHAVDYPVPWIPYYDDGGYPGGGPIGTIRPIDPSTPVRSGGGIGPGELILPSGGGTQNTGKTGEDAAGTQKTGDTIKKQQPEGGKTPVRRQTEDKKDAEEKKDDKKKEGS